MPRVGVDPQVPLGSIQEIDILGALKSSCGNEPMIHEFESEVIVELEQYHHAGISIILGSHLADSWPTLFFFWGEAAVHRILLSSLSDVTFHFSNMLAQERIRLTMWRDRGIKSCHCLHT